METDERAGEIVARAREARETGIPFDVQAACGDDEQLLAAVATRISVQRLLDAAFHSSHREAMAARGPTIEPGQRVGTYRVVSKIGQGGMGTVFLALAEEASEGVPLGSRIALKVLHPHLLGKSGYQDRFRREVRAGRRVHHPNVVPTLGAGTIAGPSGETVYFAMKYEEGRTLRSFLATMGTVPEPLVLEIARQVATGLEAIHAAGVVHRDLKPENILLTEDQRVLIMDLGVARLVDDSLTLTRDGQFAGSILYAAPEQFQDETAESAADLYALGLTMYELITGRHPFAGRTMAAVMQAHLSDAPPPISTHTTPASPFLEALVTTLLAKAPGDRFASATELREVLEQGTEAAWWKSVELSGMAKSSPRPPRIRVRREMALRGRDGSFHALWQAWQEARDGRGSVVLLVGEDGIGKTRLVDALVQAASSGDAHVLYGSYAPGSDRGGVADSLRERLGPGDLDEALRPYLEQTPRLTTQLAAWIREEVTPAEHTPLTSDALHAALIRVLRALAAERPVLWVLDDVHHATPDARARLISLARAAETARLLFILSLRDGPERAELADLARLPRFRSIPLARLDEDDVREVVAEAVGDGPLAERVTRLVADRSAGIPYFVVEMLRGLVEAGLLTRAPDGTYEERVPIHTLAIPDALKSLLLTRLDALADEERALVDLAATQGYRFDPRLLATACQMPPVAALRTLAAIERRYGIVRSDEGGHRFDHPLLQEVVYGQLVGDLRREYHARLADAKAEGLGGTSPEGEAAYFLALHHLRGNHPLAARPAVQPALTFLVGHHRFSEAAELAELALDPPDLLDAEERAAVLLQQAEALAGLSLARPSSPE